VYGCISMLRYVSSLRYYRVNPGASDGIILSAAACAAVKWAILAQVCWALHPWRAVGGGL